MGVSDSDAAGFPLFTFVDENIFKKETFLGERPNVWETVRSLMSSRRFLHEHVCIC